MSRQLGEAPGDSPAQLAGVDRRPSGAEGFGRDLNIAVKPMHDTCHRPVFTWARATRRPPHCAPRQAGNAPQRHLRPARSGPRTSGGGRVAIDAEGAGPSLTARRSPRPAARAAGPTPMRRPELDREDQASPDVGRNVVPSHASEVTRFFWSSQVTDDPGECGDGPASATETTGSSAKVAEEHGGGTRREEPAERDGRQEASTRGNARWARGRLPTPENRRREAPGPTIPTDAVPRDIRGSNRHDVITECDS